MAYQRRLTAQAAISRVLGGFGLPLPTSLVDSQEGNAIQLLSLANDVGQEMLILNEWQFLAKDHTIVTNGSTTYPLPEDFDHYVVDSQWNFTSRLPALGSINTQVWQQLKARSLGSTTFAVLFRIDNDVVELYYAPSQAQTLVFPYVSRNWVQAEDGTFKDNITANTDIIMYASELFRAALKLKWMEAKGFDTTSADKAFRDQLTAAGNKDVPASTVSIVPNGGISLLGYRNMPDTGYGSA